MYALINLRMPFALRKVIPIQTGCRSTKYLEEPPKQSKTMGLSISGSITVRFDWFGFDQTCKSESAKQLNPNQSNKRSAIQSVLWYNHQLIINCSRERSSLGVHYQTLIKDYSPIGDFYTCHRLMLNCSYPSDYLHTCQQIQQRSYYLSFYKSKHNSKEAGFADIYSQLNTLAVHQVSLCPIYRMGVAQDKSLQRQCQHEGADSVSLMTVSICLNDHQLIINCSSERSSLGIHYLTLFMDYRPTPAMY